MWWNLKNRIHSAENAKVANLPYSCIGWQKHPNSEKNSDRLALNKCLLQRLQYILRRQIGFFRSVILRLVGQRQAKFMRRSDADRDDLMGSVSAIWGNVGRWWMLVLLLLLLLLLSTDMTRDILMSNVVTPASSRQQCNMKTQDNARVY